MKLLRFLGMLRLKTLKQIEGIRASCGLLASLLQTLEGLVKPEMTTGELDEIARHEIRALGGRSAFLGYHGFPGAICTSVNDEVIHGIPGSRMLRDGDLLSLDCGIEYSGFYSDSAISVPVGTVSPVVQQLAQVTRESLERGIANTVAGNRLNDISRAIYNHVTAHRYGVVRQYCGHGVGLAIHEEPNVPNYVGRGPNPRLKEGMVLAIEPMCNLGVADVTVLDDDWTVVTQDGQVSAHFEHTVAIFSDHTEVLTRRPNECINSQKDVFTV